MLDVLKFWEVYASNAEFFVVEGENGNPNTQFFTGKLHADATPRTRIVCFRQV